MHFKYLLVRVLSGLIDIIIVYIPVVAAAVLFLHVNFRIADILGQLGFVVYNILFITSNNGQTLGKKIGREYVLVNGVLPSMKKSLIDGIREVTKIIYFLPFVGWIFALISIVLCGFTGRMIHDYLGDSKVVLEKNMSSI